MVSAWKKVFAIKVRKSSEKMDMVGSFCHVVKADTSVRAAGGQRDVTAE